MDNKQKLLTVNIVTYNHAPYIAKCIDSILTQKTNFDFVIRIFDDCSNDGTTEICKDYAVKLKNKIELYLNSKNEGPVANCLRSYRNIDTEFYMFIEGDDYCCDNDKLQLQVDTLIKNPDCSFCACNTTIKYPTGLIMDSFPSLEQKKYILSEIKNTCLYFQTAISSRVVRTKAIKIDETHPEIYITDTSQSYVLLEQGNLYFIDRVMNVYRTTPNGIFQGKSLVDKFTMVYTWFMNFNNYFNGKYEQLLFYHLINDLRFSYDLKYRQYWNKQSHYYKLPIKSMEKTKQCYLQKIKWLKHYILPPFIIDILNLPRDLARAIRKLYRNKDFITNRKAKK